MTISDDMFTDKESLVLPPYLQRMVDAGVTGLDIMHGELKNLMLIAEQELADAIAREEETGWGGELEILRGEVISESEYDNKCRDCDSENTMEYCESDCGEICSSCNWMGEADLEAVKECQTHKVYLDNVPEYRKAEA